MAVCTKQIVAKLLLLSIKQESCRTVLSLSPFILRINSETARKIGITDGDEIRVKSDVGAMTTKAHVTEAIVPGVIAISNHCGHWAWDEYASGRKSHGHVCEADCHNKWWEDKGAHPNWIIPNIGDPIGGAMCWMDTVARVSKV